MVGCFLLAIAKILRPGGARGLVAENLMLKQQMIVLNRGRKKVPALSTTDRLFFGFFGTIIERRRLVKCCLGPDALNTVSYPSAFRLIQISGFVYSTAEIENRTKRSVEGIG